MPARPEHIWRAIQVSAVEMRALSVKDSANT
jgi:hypothetical protein